MLTVAICTHAPEQSRLERVLAAVVAQLATQPAEILVIDNNSMPPLRDALYLRPFPIRVVREPRPGLTAARECAVNTATGDVVLFVDDDNVLQPGYMRAVFERFRTNTRLGLLGGRVVPEYEQPPPEWLQPFEAWLAIRRPHPDEEQLFSTIAYVDEIPVGAGSAVRTELARRYFESTKTAGRIEGRNGVSLTAGEDIDLAFYVIHEGFEVRLSGMLELTHIIPASRLEREYMMRLGAGALAGAAAIERKWRPVVGHPIFPMFQTRIPIVLMKAAIASILGLVSPAYQVRGAVLRQLARLRLKRVV